MKNHRNFTSDSCRTAGAHLLESERKNLGGGAKGVI